MTRAGFHWAHIVNGRIEDFEADCTIIEQLSAEFESINPENELGSWEHPIVKKTVELVKSSQKTKRFVDNLLSKYQNLDEHQIKGMRVQLESDIATGYATALVCRLNHKSTESEEMLTIARKLVLNEQTEISHIAKLAIKILSTCKNEK
jgi:hypothetical protein